MPVRPALRQGSGLPGQLVRMLLIVLLAAALSPAMAREPPRQLTLASWNLGWHLSQQQAAGWIERCSQRFGLDPASGRWRPDPAGGLTGWELRWGRNAPIDWDISSWPPCDVFQSQPGRIVPVTLESYRRRDRQIADLIARQLMPDLIAFQEVSGEEAVREVLPDNGRDYQVCSFDGFKVQRLAIAWRNTLGARLLDCRVEPALSLPQRAPADQVRPGLSLLLEIDGVSYAFLTVHLKSSCVSPLATGRRRTGNLAGDDPACRLLDEQLPALEQWLTREAARARVLVMLGDFNRNLSHEKALPAGAAVRSDGSDPRTPRSPGVRSASLLHEVNDGDPPATRLALVPQDCPAGEPAQPLCALAASQELEPAQLRRLAQADALGCRNPVGLDQMLVSAWLAQAASARKLPIGRYGGTRPAQGDRPALLAVSDHCPLVMTLDLTGVSPR